MPNEASRFALSEVLLEELAAIRGQPLPAAPDETGLPPLRDGAGNLLEANEPARLRRVYDACYASRLRALCLSGGGIRSASFGLGILQALADKALLQQFDYLSTVSGGGYIGSWLSARLHHVRNAFQVLAELRSRRADADLEPKPIEHLRQYSSYLTPKIGLVSADTWAALAIVLRNMVLNWLVLVPLICFPVIAVKIVAAIAHSARFGSMGSLSGGIALGCCLIVAVSLGYVVYRLDAAREIQPPAREQRLFLLLSVLPAVIAGAGFSWLANRACEQQGLTPADALLALLASGPGPTAPSGAWHGWASMAVLGVLLYGLTAAAASALALRTKRQANLPRFGWRDASWNILAWAAGGLVWATLVWLGVRLYWQVQVPWNLDRQVLLVVFGMPWLLLAMRFGQLIYVGLRSYSASSDFEREWLGRAAGWHIIAAFAWIVLSGLVFAGTGLYEHSAAFGSRLLTWVAGAGGVSGIVSRLLGMSGVTPAQGAATDRTGIAANLGLAVAGPLFAAILLVLLAALFDWVVVGAPFSASALFGAGKEHYWREWRWTGYVLAALAATMFLADYFINVNRFSLHAVYRNRLIRAFLGGARPVLRRPDGFTGFDLADNLRVSALWSRRPASGADWRPFHVINMTLNLASTRNLAWQQRKGMSFTVTPKFCGAAGIGFGYRRTHKYGDPFGGISLGTAMAISGAAVSPNMGYHSSPSLAFLLTFFNVRLGWWLGNPGPAGERFKIGRPPYRRDAPRFALRPFLSELFGLTHEGSRFVYLSDGGHFEDFGLYEMVRRRCRCIIVCDGAQDGDRQYQDLGNAVRRIWIDLGVRIRFPDSPLLRARKDTDPAKIPYFALGTIEYVSDGGAGCKPRQGRILYIKPIVRGDEEAADVIAYQRLNRDFPQQSTADQWFDEPQLESYRALGHLIMTGIVEAVRRPPGAPGSLDELLSGLDRIDPISLQPKYSPPYEQA